MIATQLRHPYLVREREDFLDVAALGGRDSGFRGAAALLARLGGRDGGSADEEHVRR